jgi:lysophospholipase L1-like esterase
VGNPPPDVGGCALDDCLQTRRINRMRTTLFGAILLVCHVAAGQPFEPKPDYPALEKFKAVKAPKPAGLLLQASDHLAICGDSITEQKMYSRIIEDYLTMCAPELKVSVRQYGWSGERAPGFLARMTNDCLRFRPTVATTCYGMNDHEYRPYEPRIGNTYREASTAIIDAFKAHGARVVQGSPGCVGKLPAWVKSAEGTVDDLNLNLCNLRNIGIKIAENEKVRFADVFWPMLMAGAEGQKMYGTNYAIAGSDGVHPGWGGQTVMAYAFLKALGLEGEIGRFTFDARSKSLRTSKGHELLSTNGGVFQIRSSRYPFCVCVPPIPSVAPYPVCDADPASDGTIRSALSLIPFQQQLNRLNLVLHNGSISYYRVSWGEMSKTFAGDQLARGINLAEEFLTNPFSKAFARVDAAVAAKQAYETKQIKQLFRSQEAKVDMEGVVEATEAERQKLVDAIKASFRPVVHTLKIEEL